MKLSLSLIAVAAICWYFLPAKPPVEMSGPATTAAVPAPVKQPAPSVAIVPAAGVTPPTPILREPSDVTRRAAPYNPNEAPQIVLAAMLGPNNLYHDDLLGFAMTYPAGWRVGSARRWGTNNHENTVSLVPESESTASPSMYYKLYVDQPPADAATAEAYLRKQAQDKEDARIAGGLADYKNVPESFALTQINGNPALTYFATFSHGNDVMTEYFIRVLGPKGYVMFFTNGKLEDVKTIMPQVKQMAESLKMP